MNDLDDWLNSLGFDHTSLAQESNAVVPVSSAIISSVPFTETEPQPQEEHPISNISPDDFNSILADNGFQESVYEEAEEVTDEDEEEGYNENIDEGMNLYAEENEDWNRPQEAGDITSEEYTWAVRPPIQTEAIDAVQSVNEEGYPEHNPDEEQVSEDALEAFNAVAETEVSSAPEHLIPYNSPTLLLNNATSRFSGTEWYDSIQKAKIILAGLGGIGRI